jgi:hypothetical protein
MKIKVKSQKGKWGHVGAPPKTVKFPTRPFTMEVAYKLNKCADGGPCKLTVRKRVTAAVVGFYVSNKVKVTVPKTLTKGEPIPQPNGKVGRPKFRFVPLNMVAKVAKVPKTPHVVTPAVVEKVKTPKKAKVTKPVTVDVVTVVPITPEVTETVVTNATTPVAEVATVASVPETVVTPTPLP